MTKGQKAVKGAFVHVSALGWIHSIAKENSMLFGVLTSSEQLLNNLHARAESIS